MNVKALLDIDLVALESTEKVTMMLDMTAPITDAAKSRPGQAVEIVLDPVSYTHLTLPTTSRV